MLSGMNMPSGIGLEPWTFLGLRPLSLVALGVFIVCAIAAAVVRYKLVVKDATMRGIENPRLWGFLSNSGQRGEGLLFYMLRRSATNSMNTNQNVSEEDERAFRRLAGFYVFFMVLGVIAFIGFGISVFTGFFDSWNGIRIGY